MSKLRELTTLLQAHGCWIDEIGQDEVGMGLDGGGGACWRRRILGLGWRANAVFRLRRGFRKCADSAPLDTSIQDNAGGHPTLLQLKEAAQKRVRLANRKRI
jgi:hypothetical protein